MSSSNEPIPQSALRANHLLSSTLVASPTTPGAPHRSLARAVYERRDEYATKRNLRLKIGSWNVAALDGTENDLKQWFVQGEDASPRQSDSSKTDQIDKTEPSQPPESTEAPSTPPNDRRKSPREPEIGLYVLGLQEIVDISSATGALRPYNDPAAARKWKDAVSAALPDDYALVAEQQLIGLYLVVFASAAVAPLVSSVSTYSVGTGLMGYMGNKGAVAARIVLGEMTKIVFINAHLAAGNEKGSLERRNWDASQISQKTRFDPIDHGNGIVDETGDTLGAEQFAFWFGDLNYRIGTLPGDDVRRLLMLHTENEYDTNQDSLDRNDHEVSKSTLEEPSTPLGTSSQFVLEDSQEDDDFQSDSASIRPEEDPASLQTTLASLLPHDQLHEQIRTRKAFYDGWNEGPLNFLPTYKYDVGSVGMFDSSEKRRGPSWCDRILYRTQKDYMGFLQLQKAEEKAKKRDEEMKARGLDSGSDDNVIFDYNPETDGADRADDGLAAYDESVTAPHLGVDEDSSLELHCYASHQHVLSSDHKPLDAVFDISYDTLDHAKKAEITGMIAKELDRDENESRPNLTIIFEHSDHADDGKGEIDFGNVCYDDPKTHHITIANVGGVTAHFGLIEDVLSEPHRDWLALHFSDDDDDKTAANQNGRSTHTLEPGEVMNVACTLQVKSIDSVRALNYGAVSLEDVRILRVKDGRDHFITTQGIWQHSCFGLSLEKLIRLPEEGARSCKLDSTLDEQPVRWSAPRELFRLTEALEESLERAVAESGMKDEDSIAPWESPGWPFLENTWTFTAIERHAVKKSIRESLDAGIPFSFQPELSYIYRAEVLADTLLMFLDSIDGGIIDDTLWVPLSSALHEQEKAKKHPDAEALRALILESLSSSSARSVAFTFITFMLARVANEIAPVPPAPDLKSSSTTTMTAAAAVVGKATELLKVRLPRRSTGGEEQQQQAETTSSQPLTPPHQHQQHLQQHQQAASRRFEVERHFTEVFAPIIFKLSVQVRTKEKRAGEERRRNMIAVFLQNRVDDRVR